MPHVLLLKMFDEYDETSWNYIINNSPFHKLSYKITDKDKNKKNTYYQKIINE
jgi:hypothetical protein